MNDLQEINDFNELETVEYLQNMLVAKATGGEFNNLSYKHIRTKLIQNNKYDTLLPQWIKTCRDESSFWSFISGKFKTYQERREYIYSELSNLLFYIEKNTTTPISESISFDDEFIHQQWQKALERKETDFEGAITSARTLLESTLKFILDGQNIPFNDNTDLSELYKLVAKSLNLAPEQHQEGIFKQILGGANGIVSGLGALRNKLGDAHGKIKGNIKPKERHSELAVNLAGSMAIFLFKTYKVNSIISTTSID
jgi:hypothetical protein